MTPRLDPFAAAPDAMRAMLEFSRAAMAAGIEPRLAELVKLRASQINGCAFCLDMHAREARWAGESEARIYLLDAWREAPHYSPRERAALAWTEALTRIADTRAPGADFEALQPHFSDAEIVALSLLVVAINGWNRLAIGFRSVPSVDGAAAAAAHARAAA